MNAGIARKTMAALNTAEIRDVEMDLITDCELSDLQGWTYCLLNDAGIADSYEHTVDDTT
jgi:hypothetical protein